MHAILNGILTPAQSATVPLLDEGLLQGIGLIETMAAFGGQLPLFERHFKRLSKSAERFGLKLPRKAPEILEDIGQLLEADGLLDARIRLTLTRGNPDHDVPPMLALHATPLPTPPRTMTAGISQTLRLSSVSPLAGHKTLSYFAYRWAREEAKMAGFDEALLLDTDGYLAEGAATNLFVISEGQILTPALKHGGLAGVARGLVLELLNESNCQTASIRPEALSSASEAFLTNAVIGVVPLVALDGRPIGNGLPGPVTRGMQTFFREALYEELSRS
jgi:branched-subunit amino acid aminotransferase/4-amino-4-deoxychorismate lyase